MISDIAVDTTCMRLIINYYFASTDKRVHATTMTDVAPQKTD